MLHVLQLKIPLFMLVVLDWVAEVDVWTIKCLGVVN